MKNVILFKSLPVQYARAQDFAWAIFLHLLQPRLLQPFMYRLHLRLQPRLLFPFQHQPLAFRMEDCAMRGQLNAVTVPMRVSWNLVKMQSVGSECANDGANDGRGY